MRLAAEIVPYACKIAVAAAMPKIANVDRIHYMGEKYQTFLILHRKTLNATHSNVSKKNIKKRFLLARQQAHDYLPFFENL